MKVNLVLLYFVSLRSTVQPRPVSHTSPVVIDDVMLTSEQVKALLEASDRRRTERQARYSPRADWLSTPTAAATLQVALFNQPTPFIFHKWPNPQEIPFEFGTYYDDEYFDVLTDAQRSNVLDAMDHITWATDGCIKFYETRGHSIHTNRLHLAVELKRTRGAKANLGMIQHGATLLYLPPQEHDSMRMGVVAHELLHTLGMLHTHQRIDRDQYIRIQWHNMKSNVNYINYDVLPWSKSYNTTYDYRSIMHYSSCHSAARPCATADVDDLVIVKADGSDLRGVIGQRDGLSVGDARTLKAVYCPEMLQ